MVDNLNADEVDGYDASAFPLLAGRAGGQVLYGGTGAGDDLTLHSTSHGTKGIIYFGASALYDQGAFTQSPLSSDPGDPAAGSWTWWCSDGTDSFGAGDVIAKINVGAVVKTIRLISYSAH